MPEGHTGPPDGRYVAILTNGDYAVRFAALLSTFVHLEERMGYVLAALLNSTDHNPAGFVLRAIKSPKGRLDVMRDLLELAPYNADVPENYDAIIREFSQLSRIRNIYAHGLWWTSAATQEVYLAEENEDGYGFTKARPVTLEELEAAITRIGELRRAIEAGPMQDVAEMRGRQSLLERSASPPVPRYRPRAPKA